MYVITYSLRENQTCSDNYYTKAAAFTDEVLQQATDLLQGIIDGYRVYYNTRNEEISSREELVLELLTLGTLWQVYSGDALGLDEGPGQVLTGLARARECGGSLKPGIDFLRGIMSTLFLSPDLYDNMFSLDPNMNHFDKLLLWLEASGEFKQEAKRLRTWQVYLNSLTHREAVNVLLTAVTFAVWFEARSNEELGPYTPNVERYLNEIRPEHYWREDVIFCGRRRVEYHLNMVGAEIMNRAFRESFLKTKNKVLLLPACMRLLTDSRCKMESEENGCKCCGCMPDCAVNRLSSLGRKYGFKVMVVPHESSISAGQTQEAVFDKDTGVIGVACVLNLISGGWMLEDMGIPAQCVLLDYCGCKNHWHHEGLQTDINIKQLECIMGIGRESVFNMV